MICVRCVREINEGELIYYKVDGRGGRVWFHQCCDEIEVKQ